MRFPLFALLIFVSVARADGVAQTHPEFSGRWVLVGASGDSVDLAHTVAVHATTVDTDASGRPMAPYISALSVSREIDGAVPTETLRVGLQGGGGVSGVSTAARPEVHNFWSVRWADDCLVIYVEHSSGTADSGPTDAHSRTEQWCMNAARQLVVAIRRTQSSKPPLNATRVYRRQ